MIPAYVVYDEDNRVIAVLYEEGEAIRLIQLGAQRGIEGADSWRKQEAVLANNADKFFAAWRKEVEGVV